ncbi:M48 family metallopeptidase [Pedosphaera parvula]|uniref:Peptidase M48 Ste24p n=1 Tax=Pedosphaera parvula (strain Ellin514) TaxID=320771 RepID=B9XLT9_PEDPL|nr:M48 family metallopeptidase [Pedosphaera parvula]EEF59196.1 peptidase M48 Ste24p [Pedosphaera parvula Ellin514]
MDFFQRQDAARRTTKWLVVYFIIAVLGILLAVNFAVGVIFSGTQHSRHQYGAEYRARTYDPRVFGLATLGTLLVIFCGSTYKTLQLSSGGSAVAEMMGGRPIDSNTSDPDERKFLNVVEEMSIASGTPVPQVYVMDGEPGINAFAAGHSTKDMVICATRGCLRLLTRDELQGVIGHEFSHILNGDMRLNLRLMGLVFGILCIAMFGRILMDQRGSRYRERDRDRGSIFVLGIALFIIGWIGVFFSSLIKSAVSRQREFLADAASVQFTRNPEGLANALKKVGGCGSSIEDPNAEEASHLFFANGLSESLSNIFSTHPPLEERIKRLDPSFEGKFTEVNLHDAENQIQEQMQPAEELPPRIVRAPQLADLIGGQRSATSGLGTVGQTLIISETIGAPTGRHLDYAADLRSKLPQDLDMAARDPMSAVALVYAILLSPEEGMRTRQLQQLQQKIDPAIYQETLRLVPRTIALEVRSKCPLATIAMTALRRFIAGTIHAVYPSHAVRH